MKKDSSEQKKRKPYNNKDLRRNSLKESGESYLFSPAQIAIIFELRQYGYTWKEIATNIGYSECHFHRIRSHMNIDESLDTIKTILRNEVNRAMWARSTGMPKISESRKTKRIPTGEIGKDGKPIYTVEITEEVKRSRLAPDPTAAELWMAWNGQEGVEVLPVFTPISEVPEYEEK